MQADLHRVQAKRLDGRVEHDHRAFDPAAFGTGFRTAMVVCAGLLVAGALVAALLVRRPLTAAGPQQRLPIEECAHCGVTGPQVHPREPAASAGEGRR